MSIGLSETQLVDIPVPIFNPVGLMQGAARGKLQISLADIAERITAQLSDLAIDAAASTSVEEFRAARQRLVPAYTRLCVALTNTIIAKLDLADLPGIIEASFVEWQADFEANAHSYFGDEIYQEILFAIVTLKNAHSLLPQLLRAKLDSDLSQQDMELAARFNASAVWADFHLTGLRVACQSNQRITREVLQELLTGARLAVMAYSYVRAALDLRKVLDSRYEEKLDVSWDAEDEALANAE